MTEENKPLLNESIHFDKQSDSDTTCTPIMILFLLHINML